MSPPNMVGGYPGLVELALGSPVNITSTSVASPIVVHVAAVPGGWAVGDSVVVAGAADTAANGEWLIGALTGATVTLTIFPTNANSTSGGGGGAAGTIENLGFAEVYQIPVDLTDPTAAQSVNVAFEALGDRTAWLKKQLSGDASFNGDKTFNGNVDIEGTLNVDGASTLGSTLGVTGNATVGGTLGVTGHLTVGDIPTISPPAAVTRSVANAPQNSVTATHVWTSSGLPLNAGDSATHMLDVPHGASLTSVTVWITGGAHGALPGNMPSFFVERIPLASAGFTNIGGTTDTSGSTVVYDVRHALTATLGTPEVIDRTAYMYTLEFSAESGMNSNNASIYVGATWTASLANLGP